MKLSKKWEKSKNEMVDYHKNYFHQIFQNKRVNLYLDITNENKTYLRPEMIKMLKDCKEGKIEVIATATRAYLGRNTDDFCFFLKYIFDLPYKIDILTFDMDKRIDTIGNVENQKECLKEMVDKYVMLKSKEYERWKKQLIKKMVIMDG